MESSESDERSSPDSWSTSDLSSLAEYSSSFQSISTDHLSKTSEKDLIYSIFSWAKSKQPQYYANKQILKPFIKEIFKESLDFLMENFDFRCCSSVQHSSKCLKRWKGIEEKILELVDEEILMDRPVFSITKRQKKRESVLLDKSQPFWIQKIMVQNLFINSKY
jgi:hypothetical protein